jgi:hypothetical protein
MWKATAQEAPTHNQVQGGKIDRSDENSPCIAPSYPSAALRLDLPLFLLFLLFLLISLARLMLGAAEAVGVFEAKVGVYDMVGVAEFSSISSNVSKGDFCILCGSRV